MEKFSLQHVVLYSKHWYERTDDFWADIKKCLTADGYCGEYMTNNNAANVILKQFERIPPRHDNSISAVVFGIMEHEIWKCGYYTNSCKWVKDYDKLPEYEVLHAIVSYCLSSFCNMETKYWTPVAPDTKNVLPLRKGTTKKHVKEMFTKKLTNETEATKS